MLSNESTIFTLAKRFGLSLNGNEFFLQKNSNSNHIRIFQLWCKYAWVQIYLDCNNQTILYSLSLFFNFFIEIIFIFILLYFPIPTVSRLMGGSASGSMGHMGNMGGLAACSVNDSKPMQFPLAQRRKRRVLFTQAQVSPIELFFFCFFSFMFHFIWSVYREYLSASYTIITCNPFEANCFR